MTFKGFSKLYKADGTLLGTCVVMYYTEKINFTNMPNLDFYLCKTGKRIHTEDPRDTREIKKADCGIDYIASYKDDLGQMYYLTPLTKTIEIEF